MRPETDYGKNSPAMPLRKRGFLQRLARDARGNALAITAACMIPIAAAIGGGVDMSRAYLAKARLNQACDAASLAGRRAMTNEDVATAEPEALKFFNFNFPQGTMQTAAFVPKVTHPDTGVIRVEAATTVPTSVMKIFGFKEIPISVECDATQNFNNIDIVLVLDVTGSMGDPIDGVDKINSLKTAVMALYDELSTAQTQLNSQGLRIRYGIVPYSASVNVGYLVRAKNASYIATSHPYQSRVANWGTETYIDHYDTTSSPSSATVGPVTTTKTNKRNACIALNGTAVTGPTSTVSGNTTTTTTVTKTVVATHSTSSGNSNGTCTIKTTTKTDTVVSTTTPVYATRPLFLNWTYGPTTSYDTTLAQYVTGASVTTQTGSNGANVSSSWNGCIEERETVPTITATSATGTSDIPSGAWDLNIDMIPTGDQKTKWAPQWNKIIYPPKLPNPSTNNSSSNPTSYCPVEAKRLAVMTRNQLDTYVNTLSPVGNTYHDIGMIWGARFISSNGIFGDDNPTSYLKPGASGTAQPVSKYIVFMTDGTLEPDSSIYATYGVETLDQRIKGGTYNTAVTGGNGSDLEKRHSKRFLMACNAAKSGGATIYTVAFGLSSPAALTSCASSADQALYSANGTDLKDKFKMIGKQIGALRLAK